MRVRSYVPVFTLFIAAVIVLGGCQAIVKGPEPTQVSDLEFTQAVETIAAELTQSASQVTSTLDAQALGSLTPEGEVMPPTSTPEPSETLPPTSTPLPTDTPLPTETPTPEFTATPTFTPEPQWRLTYQDDLKSGFWVTEKADNFRLQYSYGGYMITNLAPKDIIFSVRNEPYGNVRVEVTGKRISGPIDGYYGVICNFVNGGNYYILGVGFDGWYGIGMKQGGQLRWLDEGYDTTGAVRMAGQENGLRADCVNGKLTLWANEVQLASVEDRTFNAGQVGLGVGNRDVGGSAVVFMDFMIYIQEQPQ